MYSSGFVSHKIIILFLSVWSDAVQIVKICCICFRNTVYLIWSSLHPLFLWCWITEVDKYDNQWFSGSWAHFVVLSFPNKEELLSARCQHLSLHSHKSFGCWVVFCHLFSHQYWLTTSQLSYKSMDDSSYKCCSFLQVGNTQKHVPNQVFYGHKTDLPELFFNRILNARLMRS